MQVLPVNSLAILDLICRLSLVHIIDSHYFKNHDDVSSFNKRNFLLSISTQALSLEPRGKEIFTVIRT